MFASAIAEYWVEEEQIRLELEIGLDALGGFRNLMPDEIHERLGHPPRPLAERLADFYTHDLVLRADEGAPLIGRIAKMGPGTRTRRDAISGAPLAVEEEAEPEIVVYATIEYPLPGRPDRVTLHGPVLDPAPSVGFIAYHRGVAVNDFRYLTPAQTLELDWDDPWYSAFQMRALRRTHFAPMSGFLYVEPFEVRKEIVARPLDLQRWVDLGLEGRTTIPLEVQADVLGRAAEFLRGRQRVVIDGREIVPELARVHFLERTLRTSRVVDPPRDLDIHAAILGAIFVYPGDALPGRVTMDWDLFDERIQRVPAASVDQAGSLPVLLEPDFAVLEWQNFLKNPVLPTMVDVRRPPTLLERLLASLRWLLAPAGIGLAVWSLTRALRGRSRRSSAAFVAAGALSLALGAFWLGGEVSLSEERSRDAVQGLLHNIYRAFDHRHAERTYDALERSVGGDLLEQIYLDMRRGLELAGQGGARARVQDVAVVEIETRAGEEGTFTARTTWDAHGSVGHWGHIHQRSNRYRAELEIAPVEGRWKLIGLDILDEQRL